jgi:ABC-type transporter Mla subunit MlaD
VSGAIDGDTAQIDQLIDSGATISQTVGSLNTQVGQVIDGLDQVLTAIAAHSGDVASLVSNLQTVAQSLASRNDLLDSVVTNLSSVAGDLSSLIGQNRSTLDTTIHDLDTVTATIVAHQDQLSQTLSTLGSGLAPYVEISSYGQWFQVQTVYNCIAAQAVCTYDAPTNPPAGSGLGGTAPLTGTSGGSTLSGALGSGETPASAGATPILGGATSVGGTGAGGPSSVPAILQTVAGLAGSGS